MMLHFTNKRPLSFSPSAQSGSRARDHSGFEQNKGVKQILAGSHAAQSVQAKLKICAPNDIYEQEADAVADQVMRMPTGTGKPDELQDESPQIQSKSLNRSSIQRMCAGCEEELDRRNSPSVQTKSIGSVAQNTVPISVLDAINSLGGGSPMNNSVRSRIEPVLGADLSSVRVHTDSQSQLASRNIQAKAFTHGNNIFLGAGQNATDTELMAHEATHTVQQGSANPASSDSVQKGKSKESDSIGFGSASTEMIHRDGNGEDGNVESIQDYVIYFAEGDAYRTAAQAFISANYPDFNEIEANSLEVMFEQLQSGLQASEDALAIASPNQRLHVGQIILVTHASVAPPTTDEIAADPDVATQAELFIAPTAGSDERVSAESLAELRAEFLSGMHARFRRHRDDIVARWIDERTVIEVRGCRVAQGDETMQALRSLFGGNAAVRATVGYQGYATLLFGGAMTLERAVGVLIEQGSVAASFAEQSQEQQRAYIEQLVGQSGGIPTQHLVPNFQQRELFDVLSEEQQFELVRQPRVGQPGPVTREQVEGPSTEAGTWRYARPQVRDERRLTFLTRDEIESRARTLSSSYTPEKAPELRRLRNAWMEVTLADDLESNDPLAGLPPDEIFGDAINVERDARAQAPSHDAFLENEIAFTEPTDRQRTVLAGGPQTVTLIEERSRVRDERRLTFLKFLIRLLRLAWNGVTPGDNMNSDDPLAGLPPEHIFGDAANVDRDARSQVPSHDTLLEDGIAFTEPTDRQRTVHAGEPDTVTLAEEPSEEGDRTNGANGTNDTEAALEPSSTTSQGIGPEHRQRRRRGPQSQNQGLAQQRDDERSVVGLSGAYESTQDLDGGGQKLTRLIISVHRTGLEGNYLSFIDNGNGIDNDLANSGDIRAHRVAHVDGDEVNETRYEGAGDAGQFIFRFNVPSERTGLGRLLPAGHVRPLVVIGLDGVGHVFRRTDSQDPVTRRHIRDAEPDEAPAIDRERRRGLTPGMIVRLNRSANVIRHYLEQHSEEGLGSQRRIIHRNLTRELEDKLREFHGDLREDARSVILDRLKETGEVMFLGVSVRADVAVVEALRAAAEGTNEASSFRYKLVFRGVRVSGRAIAGVLFASGSIEVTAYGASTIESIPEEVWTSYYGFQEFRVSAQAGGGASGGAYWKTFYVTTPIGWSPKDFQEANISIFGVQGPYADAEAHAGPGSVNVGNCQTYKFERIRLSSGDNKRLELQAEETFLDCSPDLTAGSEEGGVTIGGNNEGGVGASGGLHLGQLEVGMGHLFGVGEDYSDEPQQMTDPTRSTRGSANVVPSISTGGYAVGSAALAPAMQRDIGHQLGEYRSLVRDPAVPLRVVGHASSFWSGSGDPVAGNLALSRDRARAAADLIRAEFRLDLDRFIEVHGVGDAEARAAGNTRRDDDPAYRRVDVHLDGAQTVSIRY